LGLNATDPAQGESGINARRINNHGMRAIDRKAVLRRPCSLLREPGDFGEAVLPGMRYRDAYHPRVRGEEDVLTRVAGARAYSAATMRSRSFRAAKSLAEDTLVSTTTGATEPKRPGPLAADLVHRFVCVSHGDIVQVRAMLADEPRLSNATWDWGGGDFETAIGAAAHTGQADIAVLLLDHGARLDLFAAAMLGEIEVVRTMITAFPAMRNATGAHGIPLIIHARLGGERADAVLRYLEGPP
jgi:hypothetical protein